MIKYFCAAIVAVTAFFLVGCDSSNQSLSSSGLVSEGAEFDSKQQLRLPVFKAMENAIQVTWYAVDGAVSYELFWQNESGVDSSKTTKTTFKLTTSGYQSFQVWVVALDAQDNVIATTAKVTVSSLDLDEPIIFSDVAPQ